MSEYESIIVNVKDTRVQILQGEIHDPQILSLISRDDDCKWQWRPIAKVYIGDSESGGYEPVYGWSSKILLDDEMPDIYDLPLY